MNAIGTSLGLLFANLPLSAGRAEWIAALLVSPLQVLVDLLDRATEIPVLGIIVLPLLFVLTIVCSVASAVFFVLVAIIANVPYLWFVDRAADLAGLLHMLAALRGALGWN